MRRARQRPRGNFTGFSREYYFNSCVESIPGSLVYFTGRWYTYHYLHWFIKSSAKVLVQPYVNNPFEHLCNDHYKNA